MSNKVNDDILKIKENKEEKEESKIIAEDNATQHVKFSINNNNIDKEELLNNENELNKENKGDNYNNNRGNENNYNPVNEFNQNNNNNIENKSNHSNSIDYTNNPINDVVIHKIPNNNNFSLESPIKENSESKLIVNNELNKEEEEIEKHLENRIVMIENALDDEEDPLDKMLVKLADNNKDVLIKNQSIKKLPDLNSSVKKSIQDVNSNIFHANEIENKNNLSNNENLINDIDNKADFYDNENNNDFKGSNKSSFSKDINKIGFYNNDFNSNNDLLENDNVKKHILRKKQSRESRESTSKQEKDEILIRDNDDKNKEYNDMKDDVVDYSLNKQKNASGIIISDSNMKKESSGKVFDNEDWKNNVLILNEDKDKENQMKQIEMSKKLKKVTEQIKLNSHKNLINLNNKLSQTNKSNLIINELNNIDNNELNNSIKNIIKYNASSQHIVRIDTNKPALNREDNNNIEEKNLNQIEKNFTNKSIVHVKEFNNLVVDLKEFTGHLIVKNNVVYEEITENNYDRINLEAESSHPRMLRDGKLQQLPVCSSKTGIFGCCCKTTSQSDMTSFGLGMDIYFKIVKSLMLTFFIIAILNVPLIAIYYYNSVTIGVKDYKDALFKTTLGNIASSVFYCYTFDREEVDSGSTVTLEMSCLNYNSTISGVTSFAYSNELSENSENTYSCLEGVTYLSLSFTDGCDATTYVSDLVTKNCVGNNTCSLSIPGSELSANCTEEMKTKSSSYYFSYNCYDKYIDLPSDKTLNRTTMAYIVVIIDIVSMICFLCCIFIIYVGINRLSNRYYNENIVISNFTLHLTDVKIPYRTRYEELSQLLSHFKYILIKHIEDNNNMISPITITNYYDDNYNLRDLAEKLSKEIVSKVIFYEINFPKLNASKLDDVIGLNSLFVKKEGLLAKIRLNEKLISKERLEILNRLHDEVIADTMNNKKSRDKLNKMSSNKQLNALVFSISKSRSLKNSTELNNNNIAINNNINAVNNNLNTKFNDDNYNNFNHSFASSSSIMSQPELLLLKYRSKLNLLKYRIEEKEKAIRDLTHSGELNTIKEVYLTARNQNIARLFYRIYSKSKCDRFWIICCCQKYKIKHLYYKNNWLNLKFARDEPSNIKWQNVAYSSCLRFLRSAFSYLISFILIIVSFAIIIGGKYAQATLYEDYNLNLDCSTITATTDNLISEYQDKSLVTKEKTYTYCFCYNYFYDNGYSSTNDFTILTDVYPCKDWLSAYIKMTALNILTIILVPLINNIIFLVLRAITNFERNKTLSNDMLSNFFKIFIMQTINTGIVILLVNIKNASVKRNIPDFPILTGNYDDFNPNWFFYVGSLLIFYMVLNIITPHLGVLFMKLFKECSICCDKGCSGKKKSKLLTKQDYFKKYIGPNFMIEGRYAQICTTLFVSLTYSSGMPILNACIFLFLLLTFYIDKFLFLRLYRIPPQFDLIISRVFLNVLFFAIFVHLCFGIWIYGNPYFLVDSTSNSSLDVVSEYLRDFINVNDNSYAAEIVNRLTTKHNALMVCFAIIVLLIIIFKFAFIEIFTVCFNKEVAKENKEFLEKTNIEVGAAIPLRSLYKSYNYTKMRYIRFLKDISKEKESIEKANKALNPDSSLVVNHKGGDINNKDIEIINYEKRINSYNLYFKNTLKYDRELLIYQLKRILRVNDLPGLNDNFDENVKEYINIIESIDEPPIKGDISYDIAHLKEFESYTLFEFKQCMS